MQTFLQKHIWEKYLAKKKNKKNLSTKPAKLTSIGLEKHPLMETFSQPRASAALPPPTRSEEELHCLGADRLLLGKWKLSYGQSLWRGNSIWAHRGRAQFKKQTITVSHTISSASSLWCCPTTACLLANPVPFYLLGSIQSGMHNFCFHSKMKNLTRLIFFLSFFLKWTLLHGHSGSI